jgi:hypothetical protein
MNTLKSIKNFIIILLSALIMQKALIYFASQNIQQLSSNIKSVANGLIVSQALEISNASNASIAVIISCHRIGNNRKIRLEIASGKSKIVGENEGWEDGFLDGDKCFALYEPPLGMPNEPIWQVEKSNILENTLVRTNFTEIQMASFKLALKKLLEFSN